MFYITFRLHVYEPTFLFGGGYGGGVGPLFVTTSAENQVLFPANKTEYFQGNIKTSFICVCDDQARQARTFPNPNQLVFVPKPNQTLSMALSQH